MKIKNTYFYMPYSIGFYPEKTAVRLEELAAAGWQLKKFNNFGICVLKKGQPEKVKYMIDFYPGKKQEIAEYLELYQEAGWQKVTSYKKRYFFFKAPPETPASYSDEETYQQRIMQEWRYLLKCSLWLVPIGILALLLWRKLTKHIGWLGSGMSFAGGFMDGLITGGLVLYPVVVLMVILYNTIIYRRRKKYYRQPELLARQQSLKKDTFWLMFLGALLGLALGFASADFE